MEKNYVVNVKTSKGTIITARGDSAEELIANVNALVAQGGPDAISTLEEAFTGVSAPRVLATDPVALIQASLGGEVVAEVPTFAPKVPPVQASAPSGSDKACIHGAMVRRTGNGARENGEHSSAQHLRVRQTSAHQHLPIVIHQSGIVSSTSGTRKT